MTNPPTGLDALLAVVSAGLLAIGPDLGHYALLLIGAWLGCMHSVAKMDFGGKKKPAIRYMLLWIGTACVLTGGISAGIVQYLGFPADRWPGVIAFLITFLADKWPAWLKELGDNFLPWRRNSQ